MLENKLNAYKRKGNKYVNNNIKRYKNYTEMKNKEKKQKITE